MYTDFPTYRERGITHMLLLGDFWKHQFTKMVQLRIPSQNIDSYNMYTHLEKVWLSLTLRRTVAWFSHPTPTPTPVKIMAFIDAGRALGKVVIVDNNAKSEGLVAFIAYIMRMGFSFEDAERIMLRCVGVRARASIVVFLCCCGFASRG